MKSDFFYITIYLSFNFFLYYAGYVYMIPIIQWFADEAEQKFRLVMEDHSNSMQNETNFGLDLLYDHDGKV